MGWPVPAEALRTFCGIAMGAVTYNRNNDRDIDEEVWWVIKVEEDAPRPELIMSHGDSNEVELAVP